MKNKPGKILVIDDIKTDLNLIGKLLNSFGHETFLSNSAKDAYRELNNTFDLIIVDALMPEMTGFDFVAKVRQNMRVNHIPVIMITSLASREDRLKAVESGINDYITKPVDKVELKVRVTSMLKMKSAQDKVRGYQSALEKLVEQKTYDLSKTLFKLQTVLDGINDVMIVIDKEGIISEINFAFQKLAGKKENELKVDIKELLPEKQYEEMKELIETRTSIQKDIEFENWGNRIFSIMVTPMGFNNILMMRDITEKKKADMQRDRFLSILSHELRTPLNGILGISEILSEEVKDGDILEEIGMIQECGKDLEKVIQELLNFVEINESESAGELRVNILEVIDDVLEKYSEICDEKNIDISFVDDLKEETIEVKATPVHMKEIIKQIVDNAVEFGNDDGFIKIGLQKSEKECTITITDNGCGIAESKLPNVFDFFYQAQDYLTRQKKGLGLGLTISKRLIEIYKGRIDIKSEENRGTEVTLTIPLYNS